MAIMRVRFNITATTGLPGLHTTYWKGASSSPVSADALDVVARVRAYWDAIKGLVAPGVIITCNVPVDVLDQTTGLLIGQLGAGSPASVTGTGSAIAPRATMMLLRYNTGVVVNGRRLQGRSFIGPVGVNTNSSGSVAGASAGLLVSATSTLQTGPTSSLIQVWHRPTAANPSGGLSADVISFSTNNEFAVLRSRRD